MKTIKQLNNFFQQKMSHIISLKVTKFQQPLLITLGVADEKPEGAKKPPPPPRDIGLSSKGHYVYHRWIISLPGIESKR